MPSSHATTIIWAAAPPTSHMTDSGWPGPSGSGRDERDRRRGARDVAGVRPERRERGEPLAVLDHDERPALLVLRAVRPPVPAARSARGGRARAAGRRTRGPRAWCGPRPRRYGRCRLARTRPASDRSPPGSLSRVDRRSGSGSRTGGHGLGDAAASSGSSGPPRCVARNAAIAARYTGYSYSHECWPPSTTRVSVTASGRAARRARGEPPEVAHRHDAVVRAVDEQHRRRGSPHGVGRADRRDRVAARAEVDAGREPRERPGDGRPGSAAGRAGTSGG